MKSFLDYIAEAEVTLSEKSVSKQQQKFMGMVHALQKGEKVKGASPELKKTAAGMSKKDAHDFAATKHKGLPKKVAESVLTDSTGSTLDHIINTFKRDVKDFTSGGAMSDHLFDALYDYYFEDMPYGVKKARDGDPYEWVADRFAADMHFAGLENNTAQKPVDIVATENHIAAEAPGNWDDTVDRYADKADVDHSVDKMQPDLEELRRMAGLPPRS